MPVLQNERHELFANQTLVFGRARRHMFPPDIPRRVPLFPLAGYGGSSIVQLCTLPRMSTMLESFFTNEHPINKQLTRAL